MRGLALIGLFLILGGIGGLVYRYIPYTETETVVDIGPVQIEKDVDKRLPIPEIASVLAIVAGLVLVASDRRSAA